MLSVLFASTRPDYAEVALWNLHRSLQGENYEIVCVAPFSISGQNVVSIIERESRGCYPAYRTALNASRGDVFAFFTDDMIATPGWAHRLSDELAAAEARHFPFVGGLCPVNWQYSHSIYGRYFANWPVFTRRTAEAVGEPFGDEFPHHFGDSDFALKVWQAGGYVGLLGNRTVFILMENPRRPSSAISDGANLQETFAKFHAKWAPKLGRPAGESLDAVAAHHLIFSRHERMESASRSSAQTSGS